MNGMGKTSNDIIGIAVFGYNRPKKLEKTLAKLSKFTTKSIFKTEVKVFVDGPKNYHDKKTSEQIALLIDKFTNFEFKISKINMGLKDSIYQGLDNTASSYENFLVFEDDIIILRNLDNIIKECIRNRFLKDYSSISLYCPFGINVRNLFSKIYFIETYRMQCWGWFTSSKNWIDFRSNCSQTILKSVNKEEYLVEIGEDSFNRLQETLFHKRSLWANQWIAYNKVINKPSLVVSTSFITNIGIGTGANRFSQLSKIKEKINFYISILKLMFSDQNDIEIRKISKNELEIITNRKLL